MISIQLVQTALCQALLTACWSSALIAAGAFVYFRIARQHSAAQRHLSGMLCILLMLLIPLKIFFSVLQTGNIPDALQTSAIGIAAVVPADVLMAEGSDTLALAGWISLAWLAGVSVMVLRWTVAMLYLRRWQQQLSARVPAELSAMLQTLRQQMQIRRQVSLRLLQDRLEPWTAYLWHPVIALPHQVLQQLPLQHVRAILAHELAHIRRLDWLWNQIQLLAETILFFHPAVWWLSKQIRTDREHATDDLALRSTGTDPLILAEALTLLARIQRQQTSRRSHRWQFATVNQAQDDAGKGSRFRQRIMRLLKQPDSPAVRFSMPLAVLMALSFAGGVAVAPVLPDMVLKATRIEIATAPEIPELPSLPELPAFPKLPSLPQAPDVPQAPELPAAIPPLSESEPYQTVLAQLQNDPGIRRHAGADLQFGKPVYGRIYIREHWFEPGTSYVKYHIPVSGSQGSAMVVVHATKPEKVWKVDSIDLQALPPATASGPA